jgi:ferredoxin
MRVQIDPAMCQGHGQCVLHCPEVFGFDEQGFALVENEQVPPEHEQAVARAEQSCPERAIRISAS